MGPTQGVTLSQRHGGIHRVSALSPRLSPKHCLPLQAPDVQPLGLLGAALEAQSEPHTAALPHWISPAGSSELSPVLSMQAVLLTPSSASLQRAE